MKKAKMVLVGIALFTVIGGALAFKAKYTATPLFRFTTNVIIGGRTFYTVDEFCTTAGFFATNSGPLKATLITTTATPIGTVTLTATNGAITQVPEYDCVLALLRITTAI